MMKLELTNNSCFKWTKSKNISVKGYLFDSENRLYRDIQLIEYFYGCKNDVELKKRLLSANGFFSVIIENQDLIFLAVDRIRSIPIFFSHFNGNFYISDNANWIQQEIKDYKMNEISKLEFLMTGYVIGNETLYSNIKQLKSGEYLVYNKKNNDVTVKKYFELKHGNYSNLGTDELIEDLDKVHVNIFERLIKSLDGRAAVVPLSGGYDSRLIVIMLKRLGYKNVICYSYGRPGNWESDISKKIANKLGYKWIFIPYSRKKWFQWFNKNERKEYFKMACGLSSRVHIGDWPAVGELKKKKLIPIDSILIPGHSNDFIQGSHIPKWYLDNKEITNNQLISSIYKKHYNLCDWTGNKELDGLFRRKIISIVGDSQFYLNDICADKFELFDWGERQSKYICNSVRAYDFWGYEWRLPFWDNENVRFWCKIHFNKRIERKLYLEYVRERQQFRLNKFHYKRILNKLINKNIIGKILDDRYGIYNGNYSMIRALFLKSGSIFTEENITNEKSKLIFKMDKYIFSQRISSLNALKQICELDKY